MCLAIVVAFSTAKAETFVDKSYQNGSMKRMQGLRQADQYTDVTLQSSDVDIRYRHNVLAAASNYFNAMFRCDLEESESRSVKLDIEPDVGLLITTIKYIYTGEVELTVDNVESSVKACDLLVCQIVSLRQAAKDCQANDAVRVRDCRV